MALHALQNLRRPVEQILEVVSLQGVLKLGGAGAAADLHILHGLQEKRRSGHAGQARPQPIDHLIGADLALRERFERDVKRRLIGSGADVRRHHGNGRIALDDGRCTGRAFAASS